MQDLVELRDFAPGRIRAEMHIEQAGFGVQLEQLAELVERVERRTAACFAHIAPVLVLVAAHTEAELALVDIDFAVGAAIGACLVFPVELDELVEVDRDRDGPSLNLKEENAIYLDCLHQHTDLRYIHHRKIGLDRCLEPRRLELASAGRRDFVRRLHPE